MEIDSKNQIWNNALCKDDIEKTFVTKLRKGFKY